MSQNLVELIRRHHSVTAPTALDVLKAAVDDHGEVTDDDRRRAAEVSGLPEAAVYGVSTFYDDLLDPRGARHVRVCTGTACFAATGGAHVDAIRGGPRAWSSASGGGDGDLCRWPRPSAWASATPRRRSATGDVIDAGADVARPGARRRVPGRGRAGLAQPARASRC